MDLALLLLKSIIIIPLLTKAAYLDCRQRWVPFELWYWGIFPLAVIAAIQQIFSFDMVQLISITYFTLIFYFIYVVSKRGGYDTMSIILLLWFVPEIIVPFMVALCLGGIAFWIFLAIWRGREVAGRMPYMVVILAAFVASSLYTLSLYIPV